MCCNYSAFALPLHFVHTFDMRTQRITKYFVPSSCTVHIFIYKVIHNIRIAGTHWRIPAGMRGKGTKKQCLGIYANDKYPDRWMLVKNVNLEPTMNSTAPDSPDGNRVPQMETRGNTAWATHPTSMTRTWPWPHEHEHYDT